MSTEYSRLLAQLFPALLLVVPGRVIRMHDPQGFVHGIINWRRIDEPARRRAGYLIGNVLLAIAVLIAGHAAYGYLNGGVAATPLVNMIFIGGIVVPMLAMIFLLLRLPAQDKHDTHGR